MRTGRILPDLVSESVSVFPLPSYEERHNVSYIDLLTMKRFNNEVNISPCLTPVNYKDTVICYKDSTRKRFKSQTHYEPRPKPRKFSDTVIVYPKRPVKSFVTMIDYHIDECRKWFKTTMEFKARTYTTSKVVQEDIDNVEENDVSDIDNDSNNNVPGPGASQIFLPRWEKEIDSNQNVRVPVTGELIMNGY